MHSCSRTVFEQCLGFELPNGSAEGACDGWVGLGTTGEGLFGRAPRGSGRDPEPLVVQGAFAQRSQM